MLYLTATRPVDIYRFMLTIELSGVMASDIALFEHGMASASSPLALTRILAVEKKATRMLEAYIATRGIPTDAPRGAPELFWSTSAPPTLDTSFTVYTEHIEWEDIQP